MNHRTPAEDFRARLAALSREQLEQAMHYLRGCDPDVVDRALASVPAATPVPLHMHTFDAEYGVCTQCGTDLATWSRESDVTDAAEFEHLALEGS